MARLEVRYEALHASLKDLHHELAAVRAENKNAHDQVTTLVERHRALREAVGDSRLRLEKLIVDLDSERNERRRNRVDNRWKWIGAITVVGGALTGQIISILIATGTIG